MIARRALLGGSAIGLAWALGGGLLRGGAALAFDRRIALAIVDERLPAGRSLAREARSAGIRTVSVGVRETRMWHDARSGFGLARDEAAIGLTGWTDWTLLRPALAEHRKLARAEIRIDHDAVATDEILIALTDAMPGRSVARTRLGEGRAARTQFAWLVA